MARQANLKQALIDAFAKLVETQPLSSITVGDLCKEVGISRNAFYTYFDSKESVLKCILHEDFVNNAERLFPLFSKDEGEVSAVLLMKKSYETILARGAFYLGLEAHNRESEFSGAMGAAITQALLLTMEKRNIEMTPEREYLVNFLTAAQVSTIARWVRSGFAVSPEQMSQWYITWTASAMKALYEDESFFRVQL